MHLDFSSGPESSQRMSFSSFVQVRWITCVGFSGELAFWNNSWWKRVFFRAAPGAHGSSQVRGRIRDVAVGLYHKKTFLFKLLLNHDYDFFYLIIENMNRFSL